jgi:hypothetical protein
MTRCEMSELQLPVTVPATHPDSEPEAPGAHWHLHHGLRVRVGESRLGCGVTVLRGVSYRTPLRLGLPVAGLPPGRSPRPHADSDTGIPGPGPGDMAARCTKNNTKGHVACPSPKVRIPV